MGRGFASLSERGRQLAASVGSLENWARRTSPDARREMTQPARDARRKRLEQQADPHGVLPPAELAAAVARLRKAHMRRMALASAASRRRAAA